MKYAKAPRIWVMAMAMTSQLLPLAGSQAPALSQASRSRMPCPDTEQENQGYF